MGEPVTGAVCVQSTSPDPTEAALFVVGGSTSNAAYTGLQRYSFVDKTWETITPVVPVTQNLLYHSAVYLNSTDTILVFAGTQDNTVFPSTHTFTIQASAPYNVLSFEAPVPPAVSPILLQWDDATAVYVGGSVTNTQVWTFSNSIWTISAASLAYPLDANVQHGSLVQGVDGSKTLYTFDFTTSPNDVDRTVLVDGLGDPTPGSIPINQRSINLDARAAGALTIADWPAYNASGVSNTTRTACSVAQDGDGLMAVSGGNDQDILSLFNVKTNAWTNATALLVAPEKVQAPLSTPSASSSVSSSASSSSSSSSAASTSVSPTSLLAVPTPIASTTIAATPSASATTAPPPGSAPFPTAIFVGVLGGIVGVAAILLAILLIFRWRREKKQFNDVGHARRQSGMTDEKDDGSTLPPNMTKRANLQYRKHEQSPSNGSFSSVTMLMGNVGKKSLDFGSDSGRGSPRFGGANKPSISNPIPHKEEFHTYTIPEARDEKGISFAETEFTPQPRNVDGNKAPPQRGSSGWNRYWSGGSAMNILGIGGRKSQYEPSDTSSIYSEMPRPIDTTVGGHSPRFPPGAEGAMGRVPQGSPTVSSYKPSIHQEMTGRIERPMTGESVSSWTESQAAREQFSSGVPSSIHDPGSWGKQDWQRQDWASSRVQSNAYSESNYGRDSHATEMPFPGHLQINHNKDRQTDSLNTVDMSWLNLGAENRL